MYYCLSAGLFLYKLWCCQFILYFGIFRLSFVSVFDSLQLIYYLATLTFLNKYAIVSFIATLNDLVTHYDVAWEWPNAVFSSWPELWKRREVLFLSRRIHQNRKLTVIYTCRYLWRFALSKHNMCIQLHN